MTEVNRRSDKREGLAPAQRALLEARLRGQKISPGPEPSRRNPDAPLPLTPLQAQIWALAQSHPKVSAYNMRRVIRFTGALDVDSLRNAIEVVVGRHEALRTVFTLRGREIVQTVLPKADVVLEIEQSDDGMRRAETAIRTPFDLASGPLIRFLLLEEAPQQHLFVVVVHHIVADEWSLDIVLNELNSTYNGQPIDVEAPMQYGDYVLQKLADIDRNSTAHVEFWRDRLDGVDHAIELPYDYPRAPLPSFEGGFSRIDLSAELITRLTRLAARLNVTIFVLMYTAYTILLARLSGQARFAVGVPSANRLGGGTETAVGLFVASLPLPCNIAQDSTLGECLAASKQSFLDAMMNLDFAFDDLLSAINYDRRRGGNPVFQTMFVLETDSLAQLHWSGVDSQSVEIDGGCAKFDLTLFVDAGLESPTAAIEFNTGLFAPATAHRILSTYVQVLEEIGRDPELRVDQVDILPAAMRQQLVDEFGRGPALEFGDDQTALPLPAQILKIAETMPDAIAAEFCGERLSYQALVNAAGRLAARLRKRGVGNGDRVGIFVDRSLQQVVAILGVQLAGAAYVPVDPAYPSERLDIVFDDLADSSAAGKPQVVSMAALLDSLRRDVSAVLLDVDDDGDLEPQPGVEWDPASPAYVIYTSGSTGKPKGVVVSHANLTASTAARRQYYDSPKRFLLVPSFAFDSSVAGIFWTLSVGGTLLIVPSSDSRDPVLLGRTMRAAAVTHTLMLPTLWQWVLLDSADEEFPSLETVIVAGEACSRELVDLHHSIIPRAALYNEYGPTEATVWASVHRCRADSSMAAPVPIGRPVAGARLYVLDRHKQLLPLGVTGELYIGGAGVSDGYLGRVEETEAHFGPDPCLGNGLVYRTGDLVRWRADGELEFLGRVDGQIKLRGYRIEPEEIEARLRAHPDIEECGVTLVSRDAVGAVDLQRTIELAERLPASLVERLLSQIETREESK